jgi:hypothetical protein
MSQVHNVKQYHRGEFGSESETEMQQEYITPQGNGRGSTTSSASGSKERDADRLHPGEPNGKRQVVEHPSSGKKLDLNTQNTDDIDQGYRHFDLNGFSWS